MQYPRGEAPVIYFRDADGNVGYHEGDSPSVPDGAKEISEQDWRDAMQAWEAAREAKNAALRADRELSLKSAYEELITIGMSDAAARAVSGYSGPA